MKRLDLVGERFGRLTVIEFAYVKNEHSHWRCRCDCGNECVVDGYKLKSKHTKSCGCLHKVHRKTNTRLYRIWRRMKDRCYNPNYTRYKNYGGRGIIICDEWNNDFMAFYNWALSSDYNDELTIDRIDVNGNYEPSNCRWVDMKTQQRNRKNNVIVEYQGEKICLAEAAEISGIDRGVLRDRYERGCRGERLFRPVRKMKRKK